MDAQKLQKREKDNAIEREIIRLTLDKLTQYEWLFTDNASMKLSGDSHKGA